MTTPKMMQVFSEAVDIKKLHKPEDLIAQTKEMAVETDASVAALLKFLDVHKKDTDWPEYIKARIPMIRSALKNMSTQTQALLDMLQKFKGALPAEEAANQPAGKTFEGQ